MQFHCCDFDLNEFVLIKYFFDLFLSIYKIIEFLQKREYKNHKRSSKGSLILGLFVLFAKFPKPKLLLFELKLFPTLALPIFGEIPYCC